MSRLWQCGSAGSGILSPVGHVGAARLQRCVAVRDEKGERLSETLHAHKTLSDWPLLCGDVRLLSLHVDVRAQVDPDIEDSHRPAWHRYPEPGSGTVRPSHGDRRQRDAISHRLRTRRGTSNRRLAEGAPGLSVLGINHVFLTHLHSDHTAGYPDLILTPWSVGRTHALEVCGPRGLAAMTRHILEAYAEDIRIRRQDKKTLGRPNEVDGYRVNPHEIAPGIVYRDSNVKVTAFLVRHGDVPRAFGYRFDTPDRSIVISGDADVI